MDIAKILVQKGTRTRFVWTEALAARPDMEPWLGSMEDHQVIPISASSSDTLTFSLSAGGIGDAVCGLYAACGLAQQGHKVVFYAKHRGWFPPLEQPNLTVLPHEEGRFDANLNYRQQLKEALADPTLTRPGWYIRNIAQRYGIAECKPARPEMVRLPLVKRNGVLLAPFSSHISRDWWFMHYRRLAKNLTEAGIPVSAIAAEEQRQRLEDTFYGIPVKLVIGRPVAEVTAHMASSCLLVGNDSGMPHVAGLWNVPALSLAAQFRPNYLFACGDSVQVISPGGCAGCHNLPEGGWEQGCNTGCSALQSIDVASVTDVIKEIYETA